MDHLQNVLATAAQQRLAIETIKGSSNLQGLGLVGAKFSELIPGLESIISG